MDESSELLEAADFMRDIAIKRSAGCSYGGVSAGRMEVEGIADRWCTGGR